VCSRAFVFILLLSCTPLALADNRINNTAETNAPAVGWKGSKGEVGFASSRGNSSTESFNSRLGLRYTRYHWKHNLDLFGLRSSARYVNTDSAGNTTKVRQTTANRYSIAAGSAWQMGEYRQLTTSARYEHDSFSNFDSLYIVGITYGSRWIDGESVVLEGQFGPGARRAHDVLTEEYETELIARGVFDFKWNLTDNTELVNTLLIESGSSNTFVQNDLGILVAMNKHLALKAGWQARYNSDVDPGMHSTDTLATMNVVYRFR